MFNKDFVWGVASSAYQIEGRTADDAIGPSIWDQFIANGNTADGYDATTACDHVNRYAEDYALMRLLGIKAYRFSLSWPRIMPAGTGTVNEKAIALYRDMILEMKKNGVEPYITLFHWDLPLALYEKGGWQNEEIIEWFAAYARVVAENFSDICDYFITLNEPQCFVGIGHLAGRHAPGVQLAPKEVFQIAHNAFRAHGRAVIALREHSLRPIKIGYAPSCTVAYPMSDSPADIEAARKVQFGFHMPLTNWTWNWAWFCDPVFLGHYPEEGLKKFAEHLPEFTEADMKLIAQPLDFMGLNIYNGYLIKAGENGEPEFPRQPKGAPKTAALWPFTPDCFYWGVRYLSERYPLPAYITENGMSCHDTVSADGRVHDPNR
ncbi:MAG: family 1 glycosylhydrolase, partial [Lachnospiraceae bacterium]|nr:family 1 glycosylhydrolase [Lachnospiraceae bacterium]